MRIHKKPTENPQRLGEIFRKLVLDNVDDPFKERKERLKSHKRQKHKK